VSLITTKQASQANGTSGQAAQEWARQTAQYLRARQLVAQAQMAPLAANARAATQQGIYGARAWSAPRLDHGRRGGHRGVRGAVAAEDEVGHDEARGDGHQATGDAEQHRTLGMQPRTSRREHR